MNTLYKTLATWFGVGYAPLAPGTAGAALGAIMVYVWQYLDPSLTIYGWPLVWVTIVTTLVGVYVSDQLEPEWGKDPSRIVIDEAIGIWIAILFVPVSVYYLFAGFVLFRIFDIWKPLGIRKLEALPGGWGVMMDDVLAGIYANIVLQGYIYFWG